ncbi:Lrp/AsnC ligand binding domain-containing protein [Candidatus Bathyarchaeota archaeon]|nr:Lrp/AsnC ligand binding domain-containing protein [Candidatus Bathyarchaeota archaeon]
MSVKAYIMMNVKTGSEDKVSETILKLNEVEEASVIYGEYDLILKVNAKDMNHLDKLIVEKLRSIPDIMLTATMLIAKEYK